LKPAYESGPKAPLVGGAKGQVIHVGIQVGFPLGVEGVRIDPCAHIVEFHLGCVPDVDAVDPHGNIQKQKAKDHVDGQDYEDGVIGKVAPFA